MPEPMLITLGDTDFRQLLGNQLRHNFLLSAAEAEVLVACLPEVLERTAVCFAQSANKYYRDENGRVCFNPMHAAQYTIFLYFLAYTLAQRAHIELADKVYYLNRMLNGCDLYHQICLPPIFMLDHPLASVIGRADIGNYFVFQQGCTVGGNHGIYPRLGELVMMFANSTIIGRCSIGNNVMVATGTIIKDQDIPDNSIVFGQSPHLVVKTRPTEYFYRQSPFLQHRGVCA